RGRNEYGRQHERAGKTLQQRTPHGPTAASNPAAAFGASAWTAEASIVVEFPATTTSATAPECSVTTAAFHVPLGPEAETIAACASSPTALTSTGVTTAGSNPGFSTLNTTISAPRNAETNPALFVLGITVTIW